jgi:hypothetical protein
LNHDDEINRRIELFSKCNDDATFRALEVSLCKENIFHFINNWCWTFDPRPRAEHSHLPFILYEFQYDSIKWIDERFANSEVGIIEKSRDMGATWMLVVWALHKWLFNDGFTCLFGSKTEGDVDDASIDSIFGKVRYVLNNLPWFMKPNMKAKINERREADTYLSIINPTNGNEISGDSANSNFGRSGRRSIVFLDEYAFVDQSDKIWSAISEVSNCIIPVSTANGKGNMFYSLRSKGTIPVLSLHWSRHPHKDQAWYDDKKKTMEPHQIAQELDIDYSSSKAGRVYKRFEKRWHVAKEIIYPKEGMEQFVTLDFGISDATAVIFGQIDVQENIEIYGCYDCTDQDIEFFIPMFRGELPPRQYWEFIQEYEQTRIKNLLTKVFMSDKKSFFKPEFTFYGDFAGTARGANSRYSIRDRMASAGIKLNCNPRQDFATRIQCVDNLLKLRENKRTNEMMPRFVISPDCNGLIDAIMNYVWSNDDLDSSNLKPKHDWASHYVSALEFLAINRFNFVRGGSVTVDKVR